MLKRASTHTGFGGGAAAGESTRPSAMAEREFPFAHADRGPAFVHHAVMRSAQLHQIRELCLSTATPMLNVMCIDEVLMGTPRKPAPLVPHP
jgi:hypothetical protein